MFIWWSVSVEGGPTNIENKAFDLLEEEGYEIIYGIKTTKIYSIIPIRSRPKLFVVRGETIRKLSSEIGSKLATQLEEAIRDRKDITKINKEINEEYADRKHTKLKYEFLWILLAVIIAVFASVFIAAFLLLIIAF
jgi:hypothetical protein